MYLKMSHRRRAIQRPALCINRLKQKLSRACQTWGQRPGYGPYRVGDARRGSPHWPPPALRVQASVQCGFAAGEWRAESGKQSEAGASTTTAIHLQIATSTSTSSASTSTSTSTTTVKQPPCNSTTLDSRACGYVHAHCNADRPTGLRTYTAGRYVTWRKLARARVFLHVVSESPLALSPSRRNMGPDPPVG